jgi:S1-C subfamily serine protease
MQLRDLAIRGDYLNTEKYYEELDAINSQSINLRNELGDDQYDEYLFKSRKNNRIQISTVMLGSIAEQVGIQKNDVVLNYDNKRMFHSAELIEATTQGQLGDYVAIDIFRNGGIFSYSVPRGPLGMRLRATRLEP